MASDTWPTLTHPMVHVCGVLGVGVGLSLLVADSCHPGNPHPLPIRACHKFLHLFGSLRVASLLVLSQALVSTGQHLFGHGPASPSALFPTRVLSEL